MTDPRRSPECLGPCPYDALHVIGSDLCAYEADGTIKRGCEDEIVLPAEITRYRSRMTPEKVWPAGHSAAEVAEKITAVVDPTVQVLRWSTNDRCMHDDLLAAWLVLGVITETQAIATHATRRAEDAAFLVRYRESGADVMSGEELAEARAEHGPGTVLVNALTGRRTVL